MQGVGAVCQGPCRPARGSTGQYSPRQTVLMSWNSASPYLLCSRPSPLCFTPPKGATWARGEGSEGRAGEGGSSVGVGGCGVLERSSAAALRHALVVPHAPPAAAAHTSLVMATSLMPTMPYCSRSATRQARERSCKQREGARTTAHQASGSMPAMSATAATFAQQQAWPGLRPMVPCQPTNAHALPLCRSSRPGRTACRWPAAPPLWHVGAGWKCTVAGSSMQAGAGQRPRVRACRHMPPSQQPTCPCGPTRATHPPSSLLKLYTGVTGPNNSSRNMRMSGRAPARQTWRRDGWVK